MGDEETPRDTHHPTPHGVASIEIAGDVVVATCLCGHKTGKHPSEESALRELDSHIAKPGAK